MDVSAVIPVYNEEASVRPTIDELIEVFELQDIDWEIIAVDDGSTDHSVEVLRSLSARDSRVKIVSLRTNYGQTAAMAAGIEIASGTVIITLDADGQNDPWQVPRMLQMINDGSDFVAGWRKARQDSFSRRIPSRVANWLIARATGIRLHDYGCSLKAFRSEIIKDVMLIGEMHRMIPI